MRSLFYIMNQNASRGSVSSGIGMVRFGNPTWLHGSHLAQGYTIGVCAHVGKLIATSLQVMLSAYAAMLNSDGDFE